MWKADSGLPQRALHISVAHLPAKKPFINHNRCKTLAVSLEGMAPVLVARAFRLPIIATMTALALSGCMHTTSPVATAQPQSDLDYMAYGQPYSQAPVATATSSSNSGGAIAALRASFAATPRAYAQAQYAPAQAAYAAAPMPVAYDAGYRL